MRFWWFSDTVTSWHYGGFVATTLTSLLAIRTIVAAARDGGHARHAFCTVDLHHKLLFHFLTLPRTHADSCLYHSAAFIDISLTV